MYHINRAPGKHQRQIEMRIGGPLAVDTAKEGFVAPTARGPIAVDVKRALVRGRPKAFGKPARILTHTGEVYPGETGVERQAKRSAGCYGHAKLSQPNRGIREC